MKSMSSPSFDLLREHLWKTPEGRVLDSFFAVEIGIEDYEAFWIAHSDFMNDMHEGVSFDLLMATFLTELGDLTNYEEVNFEKVVETGS